MANYAKFSIGKLVMTNNYTQIFSNEEDAYTCALKLILRHMTGDYGDLCDEDKQQNELGLSKKDPMRIMSSYALPYLSETVWIITEYDRSLTTVLLPGDY
jgi:hypothetical protein